MNLINLAEVTLNGRAATRYKYFHEVKSLYAKHLRIEEEAGTVSLGKNRKLENREIHMIFIGYAKNHAEDCYSINNPTT